MLPLFFSTSMPLQVKEMGYGYMPRGPAGDHKYCDRCNTAPAKFKIQRWHWWWPWGHTEYVCADCVTSIFIQENSPF